MSKWFDNPFHTLACWRLPSGIIHFTSSVSFSADTYSVPQTAEVTLAWDANDPAPDGYRIYQRTEGQSYDYSQPSWTGSGITGTVYNLDWDTTYYFIVRANDGLLESADSEEVSYVTPTPKPVTFTADTNPIPGSDSDKENGSELPPGTATNDVPIVIDDGQTETSSIGKWSVSGASDPYGSKSLYSKEVGATYSFKLQTYLAPWKQTSR